MCVECSQSLASNSIVIGFFFLFFFVTVAVEIRCEIINLEEENKSLKRELGQTKKELEETLGKLTTLNKNKKRMEKAIFKQIFETKHILKRARVNLEDAGADADAEADANADTANIVA